MGMTQNKSQKHAFSAGETKCGVPLQAQLTPWSRMFLKKTILHLASL